MYGFQVTRSIICSIYKFQRTEFPFKVQISENAISIQCVSDLIFVIIYS